MRTIANAAMMDRRILKPSIRTSPLIGAYKHPGALPTGGALVHPPQLSAREREVCELILTTALKRRDIAARLGRSEFTVRAQIQAVYYKLGCHSTRELRAVYDQHLHRKHGYNLTSREREFYELIGSTSLQYGEIAERFGLSIKTVAATVGRVHEKMGTRSRDELKDIWYADREALKKENQCA